MKRAIVFAVILMCAQLCLAATFHVPADQPTIQAGIDASVNGDTVLVAPGSYPEQIDYMGKGIVVRSSDGPEVTYLNPSGTPVVSFVNGEPSSAEFSGFTFRKIAGSSHMITILNGSRPLITDNIFANLAASSAIVYSEMGHPRIVRNLFHENFNNQACISIWGGAADIVNNTLDHNSRGFNSYGSTVAKNNIVANCTGYGIAGSYTDLSYNDVWNNYPNYDGSAFPEEGSISVDPEFVDRDRSDYRLRITSKCVDAGDPDHGYDDSDGTRSDIGAFPVLLGYPAAIGFGVRSALHDFVVSTVIPTICWTFFDTATTVQAAFELEVSTDNDWSTAEMWSTGVVEASDDSVVYSGTPLSDNTMYYVRLRLHNGNDWGVWSIQRFYVHLVRVIRVPEDQPTIQKGIDFAMDGDMVLVSWGTYFENLDFHGKGILVTSSAGPELTFLQPTWAPIVQFVSGEPVGTELSGFTLRYTKGGYNNFVQVSNGAEPLIKGNVFTRLSAMGGAVIGCEQARPRIERNVFHHNSSIQACVKTYGGQVVITNNTMDNNSRGLISSSLLKNSICS